MASYWSLEPGWNTELEIRNNLVERQLTVTPVLRTAAGREIALPDVVLASEEVTSINLQQALSQAAPELVNRMGSFGSAAVRFGGLNDRNVFAAAMVYREGHPIPSIFTSTATTRLRTTAISAASKGFGGSLPVLLPIT